MMRHRPSCSAKSVKSLRLSAARIVSGSCLTYWWARVSSAPALLPGLSGVVHPESHLAAPALVQSDLLVKPGSPPTVRAEHVLVEERVVAAHVRSADNVVSVVLHVVPRPSVSSLRVAEPCCLDLT